MGEFEVLTVEKGSGATLEEARAALSDLYPDHHVIVEETEDEFIATLAAKSRIGRQVVAADEDALDLLDSAPPAPKDESSDDEDGDDDDDDEKEEKEDKPSEEKEDGDKGDKEPKDDVAKVLEALETLQSLLPKLKEQLGGGPAKVVDAPKSDEGLGPLDVGPVPGALPESAGVPPKEDDLLGDLPPTPRAPRPPRGQDKRKKPPVGVPTFSKARNKTIYRPVANEDGTELSIEEAIAEISRHPRYQDYEIVNVRKDDTGMQFAAHLKLREE